ncbi:molybdopterin-synthase adenylyltransferase MoeB [Agaribacterium sp. ZY112]|uniref:molybdopterin-synthase adenylyltransferase MoeB n=1 Tax=Agaribacterium sp. ZY112 TaxID=3233574 RepID=UPI0035252BD3
MPTNSPTKTLFSGDEWNRYARHIQLPQFGAEGQSKLKQSRVLIVGSGGLGSPVSLYLAAAGVGHITLIDHDHVDVSNLQRQILFDTQSLGSAKAEAGATRLKALNPHIEVVADTRRFGRDNAKELIGQVDLVLDCTDNFATRYLINDLCFELKKSWVFASIYQYSGQCAVFSPGKGCFRCLFPDYPQNIDDCNAAGVIGVLPGLLGTLQANEALKLLAGQKSPIDGNLLLVDAMQLSFRKIQLARCSDCLCCGETPAKTDQLSEYYQLPSCAVNNNKNEITKEQFDELLNSESYVILDVRSEQEHRAFNLGGRNIPLNELENTLSEFNNDTCFLCYCQSGIRSNKAAELLQEKGHKALSLKGGLLSYVK